MITFPNQSIREQLTRFKGFDFIAPIVKANVVATEMSSEADGNLEVVWVRAFNLPPNAKSAEVVMELAYLVGDPEEVDTASLKRLGPVRIKLACRSAKEIKGETQIFFNRESYRIRWEVESLAKSNQKESTSKFDRQRER
jgi:hypothetical protein